MTAAIPAGEPPLHPRPIHTRAGWIDLCGSWGFAFGSPGDDIDALVDRPERFDRTIVVPYPPESPASGVGDTGYRPVVWYRRTFRAPDLTGGRRLLLHLGAVDYRASVWVNGTLVARHEGGNTPFHADITHALDAASEQQVLVVRAEDDPHDLAQPRGKQDWRERPHAIWYARTTGIWQPVWLEVVGEHWIQELRWTPDVDAASVRVELRLNAPPTAPLTVRLRLTLRGELLVDDRYRLDRQDLAREIALDGGLLTMERAAWLWSPEHPNLIDAVVTLEDDGSLLDEVFSYVGMRSVGIGRGLLLLNGEPCFLRMVLSQGYWPATHLAAPSAAALEQEVRWIRRLGFNGARLHQKVEDPRFLYWADRLGLLVWGEFANAFAWSRESAERTTREWLAVVRRDASHPCVIAWVPVNESWGVPALDRAAPQQAFVRALYHLTKALDPTRPVIGNDGWEHVASDIIGIHDYCQDAVTLIERYGSREALERSLAELHRGGHGLLSGETWHGQPVMITEFGGMAFAPAAGEDWYAYDAMADAEQYLARYADLIDALYHCPQLAGFCYTQLTDTGQETNGLLTAGREPKLDPDALRRITVGARGAED